MMALQIKNIPWGAGDDIKMDASWTKGMVKQVISTDSASPSFAMFGGSGRGYQSIGFGPTSDAVYLPVAFGGSGDLKLTEAFGFRGVYNHNWDPYWSSSLFGSWSAVRYNGSEFDVPTAKGQYCLAYRLSNPGLKSADYSCNPNFDVSQVGFVTRWTPVKNLTFSARSDVVPSQPEFHWYCSVDSGCSQADRHLRVQGPGHCGSERPRSAQLLIPIV